MNSVEREIEEMVHRETRAWDARDADLLLAIFHPDMVWPWLWRDPAGSDFHRKGRAGKVYTKVGGAWKLIMHTGLLDYGR